MDSCPPLSALLDKIIGWTEFAPRNGSMALWNRSTLETLQNHVLKLEIDSEFNLRMHQKLPLNDACCAHSRRSDYGNYKKIGKIILCFMEELRELFKVPQLHQLSHKDNNLKRNQILAGFIAFLLQLLHSLGSDSDMEPSPVRPSLNSFLCLSWTSSCPQISNKYKFPALHQYTFSRAKASKELRFLLTVLGDTPFQASEDEQVDTLLDEFEQVANKAGRLVHSHSLTHRLNKKASDVLYKKIDHLNHNITKFLESLPCTGVTPEATTGGANSLFIVHSLLSDLKDLMGYAVILPIKNQVEAIHKWLVLSKSLLQGMTLQQDLEIEQFKEPLMQIRNTAYEAEYLINSFSVGDAPLWYVTLRLTHVINKLELTVTRFQQMEKDHNFVVLKVAEDFGGVQLSSQSKNDSWSNDVIVGFEDKEMEILDQLVGGTKNRQLVFIFGMPGLGKTTLAKKVYNNPVVSDHFDRRSWCIISQLHHTKSLLLDILIGFKTEDDRAIISDMDEERLTQKVYQSLKGRRYLIVMDDIWYSNVWDELQRFFPDDANGSRIMFTSRNKDIAPSSSIIHELPFLSSDQCWELLEKKVFQNRTCPPQLQSIGKKIAANCAGLPLAVVVIAGVLSTVDDKEIAWENVGRNLESSIFSDQIYSVMHIIELSYKHMPQHLKPCFLYFGMFREDAQIPVKKLTQYWIAEGFICKEDNMRAESVAEGYLMELVDKSLVTIATRNSLGGAKICIIHDLLREFCLRISEKDNFLKLLDDKWPLWNHKYHCICVHTRFFQSLPHGMHIRSLINSSLSGSTNILSIKLLRLLDCHSWLSYDDWSGIDSLVHLRYLATKEMPRFIDRIFNLEFLIVYGNATVSISANIMKLVRLKYLHICRACFDEYNDISQTSNLESLSTIFLRTEDDLKRLNYFPHLRRLKCVFDPLLVDVPYALDLHFLTMLESLTVISNQPSELKFPCSIRKLTLDGLHMPWEKISIIGALPKLEALKLIYWAFTGERWDTRSGEFKQLRVLKLYTLSLSKWNVSSSKQFPKLQQMVLFDCRDLLEVPSEIGEIETLQLIEVNGCCQKSLLESVVSIRQEQQEMGNEELVVDIGGAYSRKS